MISTTKDGIETIDMEFRCPIMGAEKCMNNECALAVGYLNETGCHWFCGLVHSDYGCIDRAIYRELYVEEQ